MAIRGQRRRRLRLLAALFGAGIVVGAGGYVALERMAQARAETAVAKMRERLPADTRFAYSGLDASFIAQSATLTSAVFRRDGQQLRAATLTIGDVAETGGGNLRAGRIVARDVSGRDGNGLRLAADRVTLSDLVINPVGDALRSLGEAHVSTLSVGKDRAELRATDLTLGGVTPKRLGRFHAGTLELRGLTADAADREVLRDVELNGLDIAALPPLTRIPAMTPDDVATAARNLGYDALRVGKAAFYRAERRRALVRGLESRQDTDGDARIWYTGADHVALRTPESAPEMLTRMVGDDGMLRGRFAGRQVYDAKAGTLALEDMSLTVENGGELTGTLSFADLPADSTGGFMPAQASLAQAKLAGLEVTVADKGILDPALNALAARSGLSREQLVERRLGAIAQKARGSSQTLHASVEALREFLNKGGRLRLRMDPERNIAMSKAMMAFMFRPVRTAEALNLRIERP